MDLLPKNWTSLNWNDFLRCSPLTQEGGMKQSKFSEEHIAIALRPVEAGATIPRSPSTSESAKLFCPT